MFKIEMKRILFTFIWGVMLLTLFQISGCNTTKPDDYIGLANLTINFRTAEGGSIMPDNFKLVNNNDESIFYYNSVNLNSLIFSNIQTGTYSLLLLPDERFIDNNIRVNKENMSRNITLDSKKIDYRVVTIRNNTGVDINNFRASLDAFVYHAPWVKLFEEILPNGNSYNIIALNFPYTCPEIHIRLYGIDSSYTKYAIEIHQNILVEFTENDLDRDGIIANPIDFYDWKGFNVGITMGGSKISIVSKTDFDKCFESLSLQINEIPIELENKGWLEGLWVYWLCEAFYEFIQGETYQIDLYSTHPDNSFQETLYIQNMIVNCPEFFDTNPITLSWSWDPINNNQLNSVRLQILSSQNNNTTPELVVNEMMLPQTNEFKIPSDVISKINKGNTIFKFTYDYSIAGNVAIRYARSEQMEYLDGVIKKLIYHR